MITLADLPPLWDSEARETADLILPLRLSCKWHSLFWYPIEQTGDVFYGLTLETVPRWRHFHLSEMMNPYGGHPVLLDTDHHPALARTVPELAKASLLDLIPFVPSKPKLP